MYIVNGVAHAEKPAPMLFVLKVCPMNDHQLWVRFNTGEAKVFDCKPLLHEPAFAPLANADAFRRAYVDFGTVVWCDGEMDIAPEALYAQGVPSNDNK